MIRKTSTWSAAPFSERLHWKLFQTGRFFKTERIFKTGRLEMRNSRKNGKQSSPDSTCKLYSNNQHMVLRSYGFRFGMKAVEKMRKSDFCLFFGTPSMIKCENALLPIHSKGLLICARGKNFEHSAMSRTYVHNDQSDYTCCNKRRLPCTSLCLF